MNRVENKRFTTLLCPHKGVGAPFLWLRKIRCDIFQGDAVVAIRPHKSEVAGSSPAPESNQVSFDSSYSNNQRSGMGRRQPPIPTRPQTAYLYKYKAYIGG